MESEYFVAKGRSLAAVERFIREVDEHTARARQLEAELKANGLYFADFAAVGFGFADGAKLPLGLRWDRKHRGMAAPDLRTVEGKEIRRKLHCPTRLDLTEWAMGDRLIFLGRVHQIGGISIVKIGYERLGEDVIIVVPTASKGPTAIPLDAEPLPRSVYWARKEALAQKDKEQAQLEPSAPL